MAREVSIKLVGQQLLIKKLGKITAKVKEDVLDTIEKEFKQAASEAISYASSNNVSGDLVSQISAYRKGDVIVYESASDHAAFVEFGIRDYVRPTREFANIARNYRGISTNDSGLNYKDNIIRWAVRRGIAKKYWYPIIRKLLGNPINGGKGGFEKINNGQGYFFVPYTAAKKRLLPALKEVIKRTLR